MSVAKLQHTYKCSRKNLNFNYIFGKGFRFTLFIHIMCIHLLNKYDKVCDCNKSLSNSQQTVTNTNVFKNLLLYIFTLSVSSRQIQFKKYMSLLYIIMLIRVPEEILIPFIEELGLRSFFKS